jgi:hypothetical protein
MKLKKWWTNCSKWKSSNSSRVINNILFAVKQEKGLRKISPFSFCPYMIK